MRIQVIFGVYQKSDFECRRCGDARHADEVCMFCMFCGSRPLPLPRAYTYDAPDDTKLWQAVYVPSVPFARIATVVSLTSDYRGEVKSIAGHGPSTFQAPG
jgi:hypothetical protein